MTELSLNAVPVQSLRSQLEDALWDIEIRSIGDEVLASVSIDDEVIITGIRIQLNQFILPYPHMATSGNIILYGQSDLNYENFGEGLVLYHLTSEEITDAYG